ncbi:myosin-J heavy chain isoform X2 [Nematostella vectensis]|uniref:myosin-J heavy chain isoform X2 n=1 Tax=Nematostella vectensis TaxID=45351 RepID=UPI0013901A99|nr:myosin-J heavy chain isoform X2 [Nematostella vectensis]
MDWEDKFSSIVKETESNLARVRDRLGSSRTKLPVSSAYNTSPYRESSSLKPSSRLSTSMDNLRPRSTMFSSTTRSSLSPTKTRLDAYRSTSPVKTSSVLSGQPSSRDSPALLNVLFERLEQQAEALDSLSGTVKRLEKDKNNQAGTISKLQDEVSRLNDRLREQGVDMETERKLEQFKREMYGHLEMMTSRSRLHRSEDSSFGDPNPTSIARELNESKRLLQEDCDSVRREVDHLKARIAKVELEMHSSLGDGKDALRRLDRLDRTINVLSENQRSQSHSLSSMVDERDMRTADLGQLRGIVDQLSHQVANMERETSNQVHRQHSSATGCSSNSTSRKNGKSSATHNRQMTNGYSHSKITNGKSRKKKDPLFDISLSDSDIDVTTGVLNLSTGSDSEISSIQLDTQSSNKVHARDEFADISSTSLSSLDSDDLLLDGLS